MDQNVLYEYWAIIKNKIEQCSFDSALGSIDKLLDNFPNDEWGYYYKGVCEFALNKHEEAVREYRTALQLEPNFAKAHFNLGVCYYLFRMYDECLVCFGNALYIFALNHEQDNKKRCIDAIKYVNIERYT